MGTLISINHHNHQPLTLNHNHQPKLSESHHHNFQNHIINHTQYHHQYYLQTPPIPPPIPSPIPQPPPALQPPPIPPLISSQSFVLSTQYTALPVLQMAQWWMGRWIDGGYWSSMYRWIDGRYSSQQMDRCTDRQIDNDCIQQWLVYILHSNTLLCLTQENMIKSLKFEPFSALQSILNNLLDMLCLNGKSIVSMLFRWHIVLGLLQGMWVSGIVVVDKDNSAADAINQQSHPNRWRKNSVMWP